MKYERNNSAINSLISIWNNMYDWRVDTRFNWIIWTNYTNRATNCFFYKRF